MCSVALHDIRDSGTKYPMNRAALQRLEKRIVEIVLKVKYQIKISMGSIH